MSKEFVYITAGMDRMLRVNYAGAEKIKYLLKSTADKIVYYELYENTGEALERTESIRLWPYRKKEFVVDLFNPQWLDCKNDIYLTIRR